MDDQQAVSKLKSGTKDKADTVPAVSAILEEGRMLEMIYDRELGTTAYAAWVNGAWTLEPRMEVGRGRIAVPLSPDNNLLTHKVVLFASEPAEYGSKEQLLIAIRNYVHRYVDLSPDFERLASYYVLLSWLYDGFHEVPYLRVRGEPGCGKSRFLLILGAICYKPIFASGASTVSPLFRILDLVRGTRGMEVEGQLLTIIQELWLSDGRPPASKRPSRIEPGFCIGSSTPRHPFQRSSSARWSSLPMLSINMRGQTRYDYFPRERILALDPMPQGFGFVVLEDEPLQLVDWGLSQCRRKNHGSCLQAVMRVMSRCQPTSLVIETGEGAAELRQSALTNFLDSISELLVDSAVPVFSYGRSIVRKTFASSGAYTKQQIAEVLSIRFPELEPRLPPPRQVWDSEDPRMSIFDALALALSDLNERCGVSSGSK